MVVGVVVTGEQQDLVVEVEDGVVDGGGGEEDDAFVAFAAAEELLEILVAVGVGVAEVVGFVDEDDVKAAVFFDLKVFASEFFLGNDGGFDAEFV